MIITNVIAIVTRKSTHPIGAIFKLFSLTGANIFKEDFKYSPHHCELKTETQEQTFSRRN